MVTLVYILAIRQCDNVGSIAMPGMIVSLLLIASSLLDIRP